MGRKIQGGAELINRLTDYTQALRDLLDFDRQLVVMKPEKVLARRDLAEDYLRKLAQAVKDELPPLLERNERLRENAGLPDRVAELERRLADLEHLAREGRVIPLRRETG